MRFTVAALALVLVGPFVTWAGRVQRRDSPLSQPVPSTAEADQEVVEASESFAELNTSGTKVVNLMVTWTKAFECKQRNKELNKDGSSCNTNSNSKKAALKTIDRAIVNAKKAFIDSKIGATLDVVHRDRHFDHTEASSGGVTSELSQLNGCKIKGFCEIRTEKGAHIVVAFTDNGGLSGVARFGPGATLRSAALGKAASSWTLAHEIGHLFGCREDKQSTHDDDNKSCNSKETWFGYRSSDSKWRDLMSLNCVVGKMDCSIGKKLEKKCQLLPVYSDPNIKVEVDDVRVKAGSANACCACKMRDSLADIVGTLPKKR